MEGRSSGYRSLEYRVLRLESGNEELKKMLGKRVMEYLEDFRREVGLVIERAVPGVKMLTPTTVNGLPETVEGGKDDEEEY